MLQTRRGEKADIDKEKMVNVPLLVLNLGLDIVDGVRRLHLEGDGLAREGLDEDLHAATQT